MKRTRIVVLAAVLPLLIAGCTPTASEDPSTAEPVTSTTPSPSGMDQMLPPTIVEPSDLEGTDVPVIRGTSLVLAVPEGSEAEWRGTTADVAVAEFSAGGPSEGAVFRPGFIVREVGSTAATLTGPDGATVSFTITVSEY
ncbi:hypothetical protein FHS07_002224 [Microbacterium proteolyticum]|uniref:Uncharacterized protein n=1 Tax=Microbacterium proteolyticum TaxID=1572644 RepID=A0A7W5GGF0_9MICO|nr:hypothetical protein [Microbacterium proteolyticum]MBB3158528.1 hypothetical protein [Microbacterium proteolyticum]